MSDIGNVMCVGTSAALIRSSEVYKDFFFKMCTQPVSNLGSALSYVWY